MEKIQGVRAAPIEQDVKYLDQRIKNLTGSRRGSEKRTRAIEVLCHANSLILGGNENNKNSQYL